MINRTFWLSALAITIGCSSPSEPPVAEIVVSEVSSVIEPLEPESLGCGFGTWNGKNGGMYWRDYYNVGTPWKWRNADRLGIVYAGGIGEEFLVSIEIDGHVYARDNPSQTQLTWRRYRAN